MKRLKKQQEENMKKTKQTKLLRDLKFQCEKLENHLLLIQDPYQLKKWSKTLGFAYMKYFYIKTLIRQKRI